MIYFTMARTKENTRCHRDANVFEDFQITTMADGSEIVTSPFVAEG